MSGSTGAARAMRGRLLAVAALVVGVAGVGCSNPAATCDAFFADISKIRGDDEKFEALTASVLLIDVSDNSPVAAEQVRQAFEQEIDVALDTGGWLVARLSGGDNQPVTGEGSCFSLNHAYQVDRENKDNADDDKREGRDVLTDALEAQVQATAVQARGSAVRLLHEGNQVVERLIDQEDLAPEQITVYLYSDLLGISDDCLNIDGRVALPADAQQVVDGCFATHELEPLPDGVGFVILAAGDRAETSAQETLALHVENLLCTHMSATCGA